MANLWFPLMRKVCSLKDHLKNRLTYQAITLKRVALILNLANPVLIIFVFSSAQTRFAFDVNFYHQINGMSVGSPIAPVFASLFIGQHERVLVEKYK